MERDSVIASLERVVTHLAENEGAFLGLRTALLDAEDGLAEYNSGRDFLLGWALLVLAKLRTWPPTLYYQPLPAEACPHEPPPLILPKR